MNYKIIGKYIKELNFNIPNPKTFFLLSKDIANYKINIDIKSIQVKQNIIEILTTLNLTPANDDFEKIDTKIIYSTIVELENEEIEKKEALDKYGSEGSGKNLPFSSLSEDLKKKEEDKE